MLYLVQCTIYTALLYGIYMLFLRNYTSHAWNRFYLIACALLPLALPAMRFPTLAASLPNIQYTLPDVVVAPGNSTTSAFALPPVAATVYFIIAVLLLVYAGVQYVTITVQKHKRAFSERDGVKIYTHMGIGPGSIGSSIFFPGEEVDPTILNHELAHVQLHHTADLALLRLLQIVFWPNIVLHLIARELRMVHEFQADAASAGETTDYTSLLLAQSFRVRPGVLEHTFFHHPIKRRIVMLQKKKDSRRPLIPAAIRSGFATLLVATGIIWVQSCTRKAMPEPAAYATAEVMPHTDYDLGTYLGNNIKYPEDVQKRKVEGRVIVKFIVDKDGSVTKPEVLRSPDQALSDEAIRVVSTMPKWQPAMNGNKTVPVYFVLPITFQLDANAATAPQKG